LRAKMKKHNPGNLPHKVDDKESKCECERITTALEKKGKRKNGTSLYKKDRNKILVDEHRKEHMRQTTPAQNKGEEEKESDPENQKKKLGEG